MYVMEKKIKILAKAIADEQDVLGVKKTIFLLDLLSDIIKEITKEREDIHNSIKKLF